jgi:hypothetical protein
MPDEEVDDPAPELPVVPDEEVDDPAPELPVVPDEEVDDPEPEAPSVPLLEPLTPELLVPPTPESSGPVLRVVEPQPAGATPIPNTLTQTVRRLRMVVADIRFAVGRGPGKLPPPPFEKTAEWHFRLVAQDRLIPIPYPIPPKRLTRLFHWSPPRCCGGPKRQRGRVRPH